MGVVGYHEGQYHAHDPSEEFNNLSEPVEGRPFATVLDAQKSHNH